MKKIMITFILLLIPAVTLPCSFKQRTDEENFNSAKAVFHARIIETRLATISNPNNQKESIEVIEKDGQGVKATLYTLLIRVGGLRSDLNIDI